MLKILIPTDFSLLSRKAVEYAVTLSENIDASFILLHCDNSPRPTYSFVNKLDDIIRAEAISSCNALAESVIASTGVNVKITSDFLFGDPVTGLETYAKKNDIDLIVMGTKGESVIENRIFGSVASGVLEHVSCPTLFVPSGTEPEKPHHITFATDLTNLDEEMEELISFAQFFNASIDVVHVYPDVIDPSTFDQERMCLELIARTSYPSITFSAVMDSDIISGLNRFAESDHPDLVAMFTYKSGVLEYLFNESYSEEMVMHSKIPLLILRKKLA